MRRCFALWTIVLLLGALCLSPPSAAELFIGPTNTADFSHIEGFEDHGAHVLFVHDQEQPAVPIGIAIDVACPAQGVETGKKLNADYWQMQQAGKSVHPTEVHVLRIGDIAICTNPYESFTDFGIRIQARSPAVQTFVVQLAGQYGKGVIGGYVPTKRAVEGGSYGATIKSNRIGHVGGQEMVDATVAELKRLWAKP